MQSSAPNKYSELHRHRPSIRASAEDAVGVAVDAGDGNVRRLRRNGSRRQRRPLGKSGITFHPRAPESAEPHSKRQQTRAEKFRFRQGLRKYAHRKYVQLCGTRACSVSGVGVRLTESEAGRRAGFAGLSTCGSIWLCPVCAAKIAARRAEELGTVLENVREAGYDLALVTLTVRHSAEDTLAEVWSAVSRGWHRVTGGKAWLADKKHYEIPGWVKAVEVTHGKNGWHVHLHTVIAYKGTPEDAIVLGERIYDRWESGLKATKKHKKRFTALPGYGVDVQISQGGDVGNLGKYLSKLGGDLQGLSREVAQGAQKRARGENRTPFQIGRDFLDAEASEDEASQRKWRHDVAIWKEWQRTAPGHRALTWAKGLREQFGLDEQELTDEDVAAEEVGTEDDTVCSIPSNAWNCIKNRAWEILDVAENRGAEALRTWLDKQGIEWTAAPNRRAGNLTGKERKLIDYRRAAAKRLGGLEEPPKPEEGEAARCTRCGESIITGDHKECENELKSEDIITDHWMKRQQYLSRTRIGRKLGVSGLLHNSLGPV
nr:protein rep [Brevibacterium aurantiacum]